MSFVYKTNYKETIQRQSLRHIGEEDSEIDDMIKGNNTASVMFIEAVLFRNDLLRALSSHAE